MEYLDRGLEVAERMEDIFRSAGKKIEDQALARKIGDSLKLTRSLVETNNRYIKTAYSYFQYRDDRTQESKQALGSALTALVDARDRFMQAPGFCYQLYGVNQLIESAHEALEHLEKADLVFFATSGGERVSHVGVYTGDGRFIHAPRRGKTIRVARLSNTYYRYRYVGARSYLR